MKLPLSPANCVESAKADRARSHFGSPSYVRPGSRTGGVYPSLGPCELCNVLPEPAKSICKAIFC